MKSKNAGINVSLAEWCIRKLILGKMKRKGERSYCVELCDIKQ
jgi:hypothetical protein